MRLLMTNLIICYTLDLIIKPSIGIQTNMIPIFVINVSQQGYELHFSTLKNTQSRIGCNFPQ